MKKSLKVILCLAGVVSMVACNGTNKPSNNSQVPTTSNTTVTTPEMKVEEAVSLTVGQTHKIVFTKLVGIEESSIQYTTRDSSVATVSNDGIITAVDEGETTIVVKAGDLRDSITVKVSDPNKLQGLVRYSKLKNIAKMTADQFSILKDDDMINFGWGADVTLEGLEKKMDFSGEAEDSKVIGRGAAISEHASYWNGGWVVALQANGEELKDVTTAHVMTYWKTDVSKLANSFRLWGWGGNADFSGEGSFRVVAYQAKNAEYTEYNEYVLEPLDIGSLTKDSAGWISYTSIDDAASGHITNAPADNMFVFASNVEGRYDLRNAKDVIITIQMKGLNNVLNDKADVFGIKRLGFICDDEPNITLTSEENITLYPGETSQIALGYAGAATTGVTSYVSSNENAATVSDTGLITAKNVTAETNVNITITNTNVENKSLVVNVKVLPTPSDDYTLPSNISLSKGQTQQVNPTIISGCLSGFTYESKEPGIVSVGEDGTLTAVDAGHAEIVVKCGTVEKKTMVSVTTTSLYGRSGLASWKEVKETTNNQTEWDFAWSGFTCPTQVNNDGTAFDTKPLHYVSNVKDGTVGEVNPNDFGLITGIGGVRTEMAQSALFGVTTVPTAGDFRLWGWNPEGNNDILGTSKFRIVAYLPNETWTNFEVYEFKFAATDNAEATFKQDQVTGIIEMSQHGQSNFSVYTTPEALRGKKVVLSIEAYSIKNDANQQTRTYVRRLGWF